MKLSLKVEYACRVLVQLAKLKDNQKLAHIDELAEAEAIPANYLVQILNELRNGGLIISRRGKQGGYALARTPDTVTLRDIVAVIDAEMLEAKPSSDGQSGPQVSQAWSKVSAKMEACMKETSLLELIADNNDMYYI